MRHARLSAAWAVALASAFASLACGPARGGAAPTPQLELKIGPKQLRFSWTAIPGATRYRLLEDPDGVSGFSQVGGDLTTTRFTQDISVHRHRWDAARYRVDACDERTCTSSNVVGTAGRSAEAVAYLKPSNCWNNFRYGMALGLSADGKTLAVGAGWEYGLASGVLDDARAHRAGAVYVYTLGEAGWQQQAYLKAQDIAPGELFGWTLSLSADGNTLAVGAWGESSGATGVGGSPFDTSSASSGAVYVFARTGGVWTQQAYVKASNAQAGDDFGFAVALSADGGTLAVGAPEEDGSGRGTAGDPTDNGAVDSGAVYVFTRSGAVWSQESYLKASNTGAGDAFGNAVALSASGDTLAVAAPGESSGATGVGADQTDDSKFQAGAVYVFRRTAGTWAQQAYVKPSSTGVGNRFGWAVALSADGDTLAAGAPWENRTLTDTGGNPGATTYVNAGAVYVYTRSGDAWGPHAVATPALVGHFDRFGWAVTLSPDGETLAVGGDGEGGGAIGVGGRQGDRSAGGSGAAYLFARDAAGWSQSVYLKASNTGVDDGFGYAVALSADVSTVAVGAWSEASAANGLDGNQADNSAVNAGAVYLY